MKVALAVFAAALLVIGVSYVTYRWNVRRHEIADRQREREHERDLQLDETLYDDDSIDRELEQER